MLFTADLYPTPRAVETAHGRKRRRALFDAAEVGAHLWRPCMVCFLFVLTWQHVDAAASSVARRGSSGRLQNAQEPVELSGVIDGPDEKEEKQLATPILLWGSHVGVKEDFGGSMVGGGWAKAQEGTALTGLVFENGVMNWAYFTNLRDDSPQGVRYSAHVTERFVHMQCRTEKWGSQKAGDFECSDGYYMNGLFSTCGSGPGGSENPGDLRCYTEASCCRPFRVLSGWGVCSPWQTALSVQEGNLTYLLCPSKSQAVVGFNREKCGDARCLLGLKCCEAPTVGVCGACPPGMIPWLNVPHYCRKEKCEVHECCQLGPAPNDGKPSDMGEVHTSSLKKKKKKGTRLSGSLELRCEFKRSRRDPDMQEKLQKGIADALRRRDSSGSSRAARTPDVQVGDIKHLSGIAGLGPVTYSAPYTIVIPTDGMLRNMVESTVANGNYLTSSLKRKDLACVALGDGKGSSEAKNEGPGAKGLPVKRPTKTSPKAQSLRPTNAPPKAQSWSKRRANAKAGPQDTFRLGPDARGKLAPKSVFRDSDGKRPPVAKTPPGASVTMGTKKAPGPKMAPAGKMQPVHKFKAASGGGVKVDPASTFKGASKAR